MRLQAHSLGIYLLDELKKLAQSHDFIGDIRGMGLIFGIEFVDSHGAPNPSLCQQVPDLMRERGVLINFFGIYKNTLKCRPPLAITKDQADIFLEALDGSLRALKP